ncbi:MAG TPA: sugar O-acetyltransferase, partial [Limosilactobacillus oris]
EYGKPVTIGSNCWLAANVTICPGVTIGDGCVIGAGAVVTQDMPANSLALGVPAKAVRQITEDDNLDSLPY